MIRLLQSKSMKLMRDAGCGIRDAGCGIRDAHDRNLDRTTNPRTAISFRTLTQPREDVLAVAVCLRIPYPVSRIVYHASRITHRVTGWQTAKIL
jgi:hypothetical protein